MTPHHPTHSIQQRRLQHRIALILLLPTAALAQQVPAGEPPGHRTYRCTVLGESAACPPATVAPPVQTIERIEPGPYARYLMIRLGRDRDAALAEAARVGEYPVRRVVSVTTRPLTDIERYERWVGRAVPPERTEVNLSATTVTPQAADTSHAAEKR
jgi:hypothetical protein